MAVSKLLCIFVVKIWHIFIAPDVNRKKLMKERFSKRIGLQPVAAEITVRCDAPEEFRRYLFFVMQNFELGLKKIREIVCIATLGGIIKNIPIWFRHHYTKLYQRYGAFRLSKADTYEKGVLPK